jgi:hypothetical protein
VHAIYDAMSMPMVLVQHRLPENAMRACFDARRLPSDNRRIGYCQSMNYIAAHLLCNLKEEDAFWMLVQISQKLVPEYYGPSMGGLQAHAALLERLARRCGGRVASLLAAVLAEIYLCTVCSCQEMLRRNGRNGQAHAAGAGALRGRRRAHGLAGRALVPATLQHDAAAVHAVSPVGPAVSGGEQDPAVCGAGDDAGNPHRCAPTSPNSPNSPNSSNSPAAPPTRQCSMRVLTACVRACVRAWMDGLGQVR